MKRFLQMLFLMNNDNKRERNLNTGKYAAISSELLARTLLTTGHFHGISYIYGGLFVHGIGFHWGISVYAGNKYHKEY
ncbi:MAG: hypothetical protein QMD14_03940 [Candidatus Aenigmarchaeota archaeon]|nr:hypothetical protein [Candidatus Aenigmarchaeota archaeon]